MSRKGSGRSGRTGHQRARPPDGARCPHGGAGPGCSARRSGRARGGETGAQDLRMPVHLPGDRTRRGARARPRPAARLGRWRPRGIPWTGNDGEGVSVVIVDTGLIPRVAADHPWLDGVDGAEEDPYAADGTIVPYGGHGTFVAGICAASPRRQRSSSSGPSTSPARTTRRGSRPAWRTPLSTTRTSWCSPSLRPLTATRPCTPSTISTKGVSATGRDWPYSRLPATTTGHIGCGRRASGRDRRRRAGRELARPGALHQLRPVGRCLRAWRKPRQRLPRGRLRVQRAAQRRGNPAAPRHGDVERDVVQHPGSGRPIAARMSRTGQNALQAWDSLQRFAGSQAIPGVGPVANPGQAGCEPG